VKRERKGGKSVSIVGCFAPHASDPSCMRKPRCRRSAKPGPRRPSLVVEDEEIVRELVCAVLAEEGTLTLCAESPSKALEAVQSYREPIHLLLTDVVMPEMHGPALAGMLRPLMPGMRVLYVSGYSENDISDQGVIDADLEVLQKAVHEGIAHPQDTGSAWTGSSRAP